ncbi:MAG: hypothetical protein ACREBE_05555 [bacterium]
MTEGEQELRSFEDYVSTYRRVLDHFDAVKIGLTATPAQHTREIFGDPVFVYAYPEASYGMPNRVSACGARNWMRTVERCGGDGALVRRVRADPSVGAAAGRSCGDGVGREAAGRRWRRQRCGGKERSHVSSDNAAPRWEVRDVLDLRRAQQKGAAHRAKQAIDTNSAAEAADEQAADEQGTQEAAAAEHAAKLTEAIAAAWSPVLGLDVVKLLQLLPRDTVTKIMQVQAALSPDEQADAMQILRRHDAEGLADLIGVFDAATLEESTDFLRRLVVDWRATRAGATKPTTNGGGASGGGSTSS